MSRKRLGRRDHFATVLWAASCAARVLRHFEKNRPGDDRPRQAIMLARAWVRGGVEFKAIRAAALAAHAAARAASDPAAKAAARAAGHAAATAHVPTHSRAAAQYAVTARTLARAAGAERKPVWLESIIASERAWQFARLPAGLQDTAWPADATLATPVVPRRRARSPTQQPPPPYRR